MRLHATIGVFDPNHKAATDKALGALVLRKFVGLRDSDNKPCGLKNLDIGQVEACVQDFETKHMGECKATVKRNFKNMWELSDFADAAHHKKRIAVLKARLVAHGWLPSEAVPARLITEEEAGDLEAIEIGKNTETSPRKRPRGDKETKGAGPKGSVPVLGNMDVGKMGDALKNIAKNAIDTALKAWENKLPNNMEQNMRKIMETTMNTVAAEVVAKVVVPVFLFLVLPTSGTRRNSSRRPSSRRSWRWATSRRRRRASPRCGCCSSTI